MATLVIFYVILLLPIALILILRSNAAVVFLALCAGTVLLRYVGNDVTLVVSSLVPRSSIGASITASLVLIFLPALVTAFMFKKSVGGGKMILNLLPAAAVGSLAVLSTVPELAVLTRTAIIDSKPWEYLDQFKDFIVGAGTLFSIVLIKSGHAKPSSDHKKSKNH